MFGQVQGQKQLGYGYRKIMVLVKNTTIKLGDLCQHGYNNSHLAKVRD